MPIEIKVLGIAYIQTSVKDCQNSFRDSSSLENIVGRIKKFEEKLPITAEKKERNP